MLPSIVSDIDYRPRWELTDIANSYNTIRMFDILGFKYEIHIKQRLARADQM